MAATLAQCRVAPDLQFVKKKKKKKNATLAKHDKAKHNSTR